MQVTSLLSQQPSGSHSHSAHDGHHHDGDHHSCSTCDHDHSHSQVKLVQVVIGLLFVVNAFLVDWLLERGTMASDASAMIGALILGWPILLTAVKDLRAGRLSTNELVALAGVASFASGNYR